MRIVPEQTSLSPVAEQTDRLWDLLDLHLHPCHGSRYWLRRQEQLGWDICDRVRDFDDLWLLGQTSVDDLRRFPLRDFIPRTFHPLLNRFVIGETAGTTGLPRAAAYRDDEFQAAFVAPFLRVIGPTGFPRGQPWLWVGPSGPHIIGKVVRELACQTGSIDPFSVDFDPRWAKRLAEGSLARKRYLEHVTSQALDVLSREPIGVLFITPPALSALLPRMSDKQREQIRGIHYGGMSMTPQTVNDFRDGLPQGGSPRWLRQHAVWRRDGGRGPPTRGAGLFPSGRPIALPRRRLAGGWFLVLASRVPAAWPTRPGPLSPIRRKHPAGRSRRTRRGRTCRPIARRARAGRGRWVT